MGKYIKNTVKQYLSDASSNMPTPGGGSVSALVGALGCTMGMMAANFTVGKEKFIDVQGDIEKSLKKLKLARCKLASLVDEDVKAYKAVTEAQALPKNSEEEKQERRKQLQAALKEAMYVPLYTMQHCRTVCEEARKLAANANPYLITDVGVCAIMAEAACRGALLNVEVNLKYINDEQLKKEVRRETEDIRHFVRSAREEVESKVLDKLRQ